MSNEPKTQPSPNAKVWAGKRIANWIKRDLLSVKRHQELVNCINPLLNILVRPGDTYSFLYSDANCILTYPSSGSSSNSGSGAARMFKVVEIHDDYLLCDGYKSLIENDGVFISVAKDWTLRLSLASKVILGETHTYTYSVGPSAGNAYRQDAVTGGSTDTYQLVIPPWELNENIWAVNVDFTGVNGGDGNDCKWLCVAPARMWTGQCGS